MAASTKRLTGQKKARQPAKQSKLRLRGKLRLWRCGCGELLGGTSSGRCWFCDERLFEEGGRG